MAIEPPKITEEISDEQKALLRSAEKRLTNFVDGLVDELHENHMSPLLSTNASAHMLMREAARAGLLASMLDGRSSPNPEWFQHNFMTAYYNVCGGQPELEWQAVKTPLKGE